MLRINSFDRFDLQNAINQDKPAFTIWFQGCSAGCDKCQNPGLQSFDDGGDYTPDDVLGTIKQQQYDYDTVVLLGGEPMEQDMGDLIDLVDLLNDAGYRVWMYTGLVLDRIPPAVRRRLHFIKTGEYIDSLRTNAFPASSNQHIFIRTYSGLIEVKEVPTNENWDDTTARV